MIHSIRPHKLFSLVEEKAAKDRIVQMKIPIRRRPEFQDYSLRLLELMSIIAYVRITKARRIFEFGTFCGNTTLHMAMNSDPDTQIWTLDADDETLSKMPPIRLADGREVNALELYRWRKDFPLEFEGAPEENKVHRILSDSHTFDPMAFGLGGIMDLVFIDGDHSREGVKIDTSNALRMIKPGGGIILWHDYKNPACQETTDYLDELSTRLELFHIEDTSLAINGKDLF